MSDLIIKIGDPIGHVAEKLMVFRGFVEDLWKDAVFEFCDAEHFFALPTHGLEMLTRKR